MSNKKRKRESEKLHLTTPTTPVSISSDSSDSSDSEYESTPTFKKEDIEATGRIVIDSRVNISCASYAILLKYNLLEPKPWEDGPIEVNFGNGQKTMSYFYVELGRILLTVALVSGINNTLFSTKQANDRGKHVFLTCDRRCYLMDYGSNLRNSEDIFMRVKGSKSHVPVMEVCAKIRSKDGLDYVRLEDLDKEIGFSIKDRITTKRTVFVIII